MAAKSQHRLLEIAGILAAGVGAYEFLYKPWIAAQAAATGTTVISPYTSAATSITPSYAVSPPSTSPAPTTLLTVPVQVAPATQNPGGPYQGSIVDPRNSPGGPVGYAMWLKNWTQAYATQRLSDLTNAYNGAMAQLQTPGLSASDAAAWKAAAIAHATDYYNLTHIQWPVPA